ncbi:MAG: hypothetical protein HQK79_08520 [Desulfobacterales bacterium]|nr:hypothetical protein [Desulfobacterales bacterium]MBF0397099.1 hypothetical protein [Desulfobacterales bacterium]
MKNDEPKCFGELNIVFPVSEDGLRHSPENCMSCVLKTECLKKAINSLNGFKFKEEQIDKSYKSGLISFLERWSKRKLLKQKERTYGKTIS